MRILQPIKIHEFVKADPRNYEKRTRSLIQTQAQLRDQRIPIPISLEKFLLHQTLESNVFPFGNFHEKNRILILQIPSGVSDFQEGSGIRFLPEEQKKNKRRTILLVTNRADIKKNFFLQKKRKKIDVFTKIGIRNFA
ncbi:hypothetical protein DLM78_03720 [Leptospira stimsonii]|uniref:Uncharacterized protein n=1 Tax=Leptospira stimsonii TaxID=2202203 RepID=A0A8B3CUZ9_9LEPT|nr:hypothetical protein DLM78_03720 [Leptospira stimsonii]